MKVWGKQEHDYITARTHTQPHHPNHMISFSLLYFINCALNERWFGLRRGRHAHTHTTSSSISIHLLKSSEKLDAKVKKEEAKPYARTHTHQHHLTDENNSLGLWYSVSMCAWVSARAKAAAGGIEYVTVFQCDHNCCRRRRFCCCRGRYCRYRAVIVVVCVCLLALLCRLHTKIIDFWE